MREAKYKTSHRGTYRIMGVLATMDILETNSTFIVSAISYLQTYLKMRSIAPIQLALCCRRRIRLPKHFNWPLKNHLVAEFFTLTLRRKRPSLKVASAATASWTTATVYQRRTSTLHFIRPRSPTSPTSDVSPVRRRSLTHNTQSNKLCHID